jgi:hypothetical protein
MYNQQIPNQKVSLSRPDEHFVEAAMARQRKWTIYLAQDKHLDYGWCGSPSEVEVRMAALVDDYLARAEQGTSRWNLDGTIWLDVYRRQRGQEGAQRLLNAIRAGQIGCAANYAVLLWGLMSTELAIRACYGSLPIAPAGQPIQTALVMENPGMSWGVANILAACGMAYLGRGIYALRAESYAGERDPYPLFWWRAPGGQCLLVHWDLYAGTDTWGGYAEGFALARMAGENWDAFHVRAFPDRNSETVYRQRVRYIQQTIQRYEAYGDAFPISSILLLGTGWDNWTLTDDYAAFVRRFNAESDGQVHLVDACYADYFHAAAREIKEKGFEIPTLEGSFGIGWEEWAAHLAGLTADFREAERLLRQAEAAQALAALDGQADERAASAIAQGFNALLRYAEHDFGGCNRATAAISAGVRAAAAAEALSVGRALSPVPGGQDVPCLTEPADEALAFAWRGGRVQFDANRCAITSLVDEAGREWVPQGGTLALGEFVHSLYRAEDLSTAVLPDPLPSHADACLDHISCRRGAEGIEVRTEGARWGFACSTRWFWHAAHPWIDVTYELADGWSEAPQSVQFCFPLALERPAYHYDTAGAILAAGPVARGGHDLPGANSTLFAAQTFAAAHGMLAGTPCGALLLAPDALLVRFGSPVGTAPAQIASMPMMNLTRNDWQFEQGGQRRWRFRYRLVLTASPYDPLQAIAEAQHLATAPYLQVPGAAPVVPGMAGLEIDFAGGPVLSCKQAEDGRRLILRLWNVLGRPVQGTLRLPQGFARAERCDALERRQADLPVDGGRVTFAAGPQEIVTIALARA